MGSFRGFFSGRLSDFCTFSGHDLGVTHLHIMLCNQKQSHQKPPKANLKPPKATKSHPKPPKAKATRSAVGDRQTTPHSTISERGYLAKYNHRRLLSTALLRPVAPGVPRLRRRLGGPAVRAMRLAPQLRTTAALRSRQRCPRVASHTAPPLRSRRRAGLSSPA